MQQNEIINVKINIDDRSIRDLNAIISDLERTLNILNDTLGYSSNTIQATVDNFSGLEDITGFVNDAFGTLERTFRFLTIQFAQAEKGITTLFGSTQNLTNSAESASSAVKTMESALSTTSRSTEGLMVATERSGRAFSEQAKNVVDINDRLETKRTLTRRVADETKNLTTQTQTNEKITAISATTTNVKTGALVAKEKAAWAATAATKALKFAMKALPWIAVASLVLNVVNRLANFFRNTNDSADATETLEERLASLRKEMERNHESHESNIRNIRAQNQTMNDLIDTVERLSGNTEDCTEKQNELRIAVELLNRSTLGYTIAIDEATGSLDENSQELIENMRTYHNLNGAMSESEAILDELIELHNNLNYAATRVDELSDSNAELGRTYVELRSDMEIYHDRMEEINSMTGLTLEQAIKYDEELAGLIVRHQEAEQAIQDMCIELAAYQVEMYETQNRISELEVEHAEAFENMENSVNKSINNQILAYETMSDAQRAVVDQLVDRWTMYRDQSREMFSQVGNETRLWYETTDEYGNKVRVSMLETENGQQRALEQMIENMRANREATASWSYNLDRLAEATSEEFAEHMRGMGIGSAGYVAAMLADCGKLLDQLAMEFEMGGHAATNNIAGTLGEGGAELALLVGEIGSDLGTTLSQAIEKADFPGIGMALPQGVIQGIEDLTPELLKEATKMAENMGISVKELLGINSPSRVFKGYGNNIIQGLVQGLHELRSEPTDRLQTLARNMQRIYNSSQRDYATIGRDIVSGLNEGLLNREGTVMATAQRIANNIARTMRQALDINSPSRVMREQIGRHIPSGVAAGIDKYADVALDSVDKLASDMVKITIPSVESIIGMRPSLSMAGVGGIGGSGNTINDSYTVNNKGLFDGATINWHGEEDIRRTMEKIAWATEREKARMW